MHVAGAAVVTATAGPGGPALGAGVGPALLGAGVAAAAVKVASAGAGEAASDGGLPLHSALCGRQAPVAGATPKVAQGPTWPRRLCCPKC